MQVRRQEHRGEPLPHVADEHERAGTTPEHAEDVGGAHVARAVVAHVDVPDPLADDDREGDRAHEVGDHNEREAGHDVEQHRLALLEVDDQRHAFERE